MGLEVAGFVLRRRVGEGGMGEVWEAINEETGARVALKFVKERTPAEARRRRFLREVRAAMAIGHPAVVRVHDVVESPDGAPVMVMEFLEGESLGARLRREQPLALEEAAAIMLPVVSAVGTAHALGVIHRDLKPENIFIAKSEDGTEQIKVLDFGLAKLTSRPEEQGDVSDLTTTGSIMGTPCYMAPEQVFAERNVDHRADVWALGIILYEALSGLLPTHAENVGQVLKIIVTRAIWPLEEAAPGLPEDIVALVNRMLERDRAKRPMDMRELYTVLRRYTDVEAPEFGPPAAPAADDSDAPFDSGNIFADAETVAPSPPAPKRARWRWAALAGMTLGAVVWATARSPEPLRAAVSAGDGFAPVIAPEASSVAATAATPVPTPIETTTNPGRRTAPVEPAAPVSSASPEPSVDTRGAGGVVTKSPY
ncbi:MAG TPA: serine/threonine-protein kinase [Polyangiaceae bacterium]|nr:serine/threonine-protein kinase [Polyangiaceae bacterium]